MQGGCTAPRILISVLAAGVWSASRPSHFTPRRKTTRYPMDRRLGEPQSRIWDCGEKKNNSFLAPARNKTPVVQPAAYSLHWLIYHGSYMHAKFSKKY